jgi:hypothetical protein
MRPLHALHQPSARLHVLIRVSWAVHAGAKGTNLPQLIEVSEKSVGIWSRDCHDACSMP